VHNSYPSQFGSYSCFADPQPEGDVTYSFSPSTNRQVRVDLSGEGGDDLDLYLLGGCDGSLCLGQSTGGHASEFIQFEAQAGVTYYIVIEAFATSASTGHFALVLTCS